MAQRVMIAPAYVAAVVANQTHVATDQVVMLSAVMASESEPALEVRTLERMDAQKSRVRLQCKEAGACLPFYVLVNVPSTGAAIITKKTEPPLMKSGTRATLLFADGHMRVQVPVISLEPGELGKQIRVASVDHKHTWKAEVVSADTLRGSL